MKTRQLLSAFTTFMFVVFSVYAQDAKNFSPAKKNSIRLTPNINSATHTKPPTAFLPHTVTPGASIAFPLMGHPYRLKDTGKNIHLPGSLVRDKLRSDAAGTFDDMEAKKSNSSTFHLTKDINVLSGSYPYITAEPVLNGVMYFEADDAVHGNELWRSDGTEAGTYMVKDIEPGSGSTNFNSITAVNGKLYLTFYTASYEPVVWVSDGTKNGTRLLKKIDADGWFVGLGNYVYFAGRNSSSYNVLWKTDGTTAGTIPVKDIKDDGLERSPIAQLTVVNNLLFFTTYNYVTANWELWRSDGTTSGTYAVGVGPSAITGSEPVQLTSYNNKLYFSAEDSTGANKLWQSDGTVAGTRPAPGNHDIQINADAYGTPFPVLNNALIVTGKPKGAKIDALYKYNAANNKGLVKLKDIATGNKAATIDPKEMVVVNDTLYFKVTNYNGGLHNELWSSTGTSNTTKLAYNCTRAQTISNLYNGSGKLYFVKNEKLLGAELWTAYAAASTLVLRPVKDIFKGPVSSNPNYLTAFKGKLFFVATDDKKGTELFMTNGTANSTAIVKDINTVATENAYAGYFGMTTLGNNVLFSAYEGAHGFELYKSDGTTGGTTLLHDVIPGSSSGVPGQINDFDQVFINKNNRVYFLAFSSDSTVAVYKTDGTTAGLQKMTPDYDDDKYDYADYPVNYDVTSNGLVYYGIYNINKGAYELRCSNGTASGTVLLSRSLSPGSPLVVAGNTAFFIAKDATHGYELWTSNGTVAGTHLVKDINSGKHDARLWDFFVYNNEIYFEAYDGKNYGIWKSDGTNKGTIKLKDLKLRSNFCISGNMLFFGAEDQLNKKGTELWKTNGTVAGTKLVKDIDPNASYGAYYYSLTDVNGTLYFTADDGVHGEELWKSDGTAKGTQLVKDITPGADGSYISNLVNYKEKLYFINDGALWTSDGTANGTTAVNDAFIKKVEAYNLAATPEMLFVAGYTHQYGYELYAGKPGDNNTAITMAKFAYEQPLKTTTSFDATLSPNPAVTDTRLHLTGNLQHVFVTIKDEFGKPLWQTSNNIGNIIPLPTAKFAAGMYFITISNGTESKTIKLVKQ